MQKLQCGLMGYNTVLQSGGWAPKLQRYPGNVFLCSMGPPCQTTRLYYS